MNSSRRKMQPAKKLSRIVPSLLSTMSSRNTVSEPFYFLLSKRACLEMRILVNGWVVCMHAPKLGSWPINCCSVDVIANLKV